jgi:N-acetylmuramic acid 6-phosphate etherase
MSDTSILRSKEFLKISDQFKLGGLTTESSHPVTTDLSETARHDTAAGLGLLFDVDKDVLRKYEEFANSGRAEGIKQTLIGALKNGGRLFFTGCGSTGRLSIQLVSIWRDFWQRQRADHAALASKCEDFEHRAFSVMAGGDFALIKAVEGFEDFTDFGKKQIGDLGVVKSDVVFAITEGGETSFVIGTAWKGVEVGAKVYFVYNNPDEILRQTVTRSRQVIDDSRIEKINVTSGPMAITGSTRMQATTIEQCVVITILEMVVRDLATELGLGRHDSKGIPEVLLKNLKAAHANLETAQVRGQLAQLVEMEENAYRSGHKNNYYADHFGIDVLTDTTERSPTFCTPPFRKFDDRTATESWAYLFVPHSDTKHAWERVIKRTPKCVEWTEDEVRKLMSGDKVARTCQTLKKIAYPELMRFKIGLDGLQYRQPGKDDCAVGILSEREKQSLLSPDGFHRRQLEAAVKAGARIGVVYYGSEKSLPEISTFMEQWNKDCIAALIAVPESGLLLDGVTRATVKMSLNALSTCTMVRLGRVMGNYMIWVVPSNLKLIDRSTRYIQRLTQMEYERANNLLFEVIEYVEPRMKSDQAYPPVVGVSVMRARHELDNPAAEKRLIAEIG